MENMELTTTEKQFDYTTLALSIPDTEFLKSKEVSMKARTHQVMIDNGRDLIEAKERVGHGKFNKWTEECLGINKFRAAEIMRITENFKVADSAILNGVNKTSLLLLCGKDIPESAKEKVLTEAKDGKVSTKRTKEIIEKEKEQAQVIERLTAENEKLRAKEEKNPPPLEPDLDNLIPSLKIHQEADRLMPSMARDLSILPEAAQWAFATQMNSNLSLENQLREEKDRVKELESEEPEKVIIEKVPEGFETRLKDVQKREKEIVKEKKTHKELSKSYRALTRENQKLENEQKKTEKQMEMMNATTIDQSMESVIRKEGGDLLVTVEGIRHDLEKNSGDMNLSITAVNELIQALTVAITDICKNEIITINKDIT